MATGREGRGESAHTIQNGDNDPIDKNKASEDVCFGPPLDADTEGVSQVSRGFEKEEEGGREQTYRRDKRATDISDHRPIKGEEAHAKAMGVSEERVDHLVMGTNPADPGENGEGGEEVAREEVPEEGAQEREEEEAFAGHIPLLGAAVR